MLDMKLNNNKLAQVISDIEDIEMMRVYVVNDNAIEEEDMTLYKEEYEEDFEIMYDYQCYTKNELAQAQATRIEFYKDTYNNRELIWIHIEL